MKLRQSPAIAVTVAALLSIFILAGCGNDSNSSANPKPVIDSPTQDPTPTPDEVTENDVSPLDIAPEDPFPVADQNDFTITDPDGFTAIFNQGDSGWVELTAAQAQDECGISELQELDSETVVHARRMSVEAEFPETEYGDMGDGDSQIIAYIAYRSNSSDYPENADLVACKTTMDSSTALVVQGIGKYYFNLTPDEPSARVTVYVPVTKTPNNPDAEFGTEGRPEMGSLIGAHGNPGAVENSIRSGYKEVLPYYHLFGVFGELSVASTNLYGLNSYYIHEPRSGGDFE